MLLIIPETLILSWLEASTRLQNKGFLLLPMSPFFYPDTFLYLLSPESWFSSWLTPALVNKTKKFAALFVWSVCSYFNYKEFPGYRQQTFLIQFSRLPFCVLLLVWLNQVLPETLGKSKVSQVQNPPWENPHEASPRILLGLPLDTDIVWLLLGCSGFPWFGCPIFLQEMSLRPSFLRYKAKTRVHSELQ